MITNLEVRSAQGVLLNFPLDDITDGFAVADIEGLDPVPATIVSSSFARIDGTQYQSARREDRNIVLKLDYEPDYASSDVRTLRNKLYGFFMPKSIVMLRFISDDMPDVEITGRVESFNSPLFTADPRATISIMCNDPDFHELANTTFGGNTVSTTEEIAHTYQGTVETGFLFRMILNRTLSEFSINQRSFDGVTRSLEFQYPLLSGDILEISSVTGSKGAQLIRGGLGSSVLYGVSPYSDWVNLYPGVNNIRIAAAGAAIPWTIEYLPKYGGL